MYGKLEHVICGPRYAWPISGYVDPVIGTTINRPDTEIMRSAGPATKQIPAV